MTKDELLHALTHGRLADLPGQAPVILQKDGEGNGYSPLACATHGMYEAETTWFGTVHMTDEQRAATGRPDDYFAAPDGATLAVVLEPVN